MTAIEKVIQIAKNEVGYLEKASDLQLDSKTANVGSANYTKYWRDIKPDYQGQPWCACFVTWCFVQAFGKDTTTQLLKHYPYVYCPTMSGLFKLNANPKKGDIVIFKHNGTFTHTGIVIAVEGDYFETVEGNTNGGSTIIANGGGVCKKGYYNSNLPGTKFCTPDWSMVGESEEMTVAQYEELKQMIAEQKSKIDVLQDKINKIENPMIYDCIDGNMPEWAHKPVQWCLDNDIISGTDESHLDLNKTKLWTCVVIYRAIKFVAGLFKVKI